MRVASSTGKERYSERTRHDGTSSAASSIQLIALSSSTRSKHGRLVVNNSSLTCFRTNKRIAENREHLISWMSEVNFSRSKGHIGTNGTKAYVLVATEYDFPNKKPSQTRTSWTEHKNRKRNATISLLFLRFSGAHSRS
ncbi:hypothetical protein HZ326_19650 [Fusarium oxysporum f. sp. albedinis]|nr:hypothetical protein HZ326_19650 [Fusarium oxysporum f. sp. albedinis]